MNYHTLFFTLLSLFFLFQLKNFKKREEIPAYIKYLRKQDEMKLKTYKFYDLSKEFTGDKQARLIQEGRNKRIEKFCRNKQDDSQSLPSDPLRFTKYGGFFCCPNPDNWLTKFSDLITKNLSRLQFTFKKQTDVIINEPSFILTEDPIQRFLKYYHYNARVQRYFGTAFYVLTRIYRAMPSKFLIAAIRWKYTTLELHETMKISVRLSADEFATFFLLAINKMDEVNEFFLSSEGEIPLCLLKESEKCQICATTPKFHAKVETASDDMTYLFSLYDFPLPEVESISTEELDFHLDELASSTLEKLVDYYADDFTAFGYDSSHYLK
jgi:hypothetical protein